MFDKLEDLVLRYEELMNELNSPDIVNDQTKFKKVMKEQNDLAPIVEAYTAYKQAKQDVEDSLAILDMENDEWGKSKDREAGTGIKDSASAKGPER